jgi:oligo-1,6-glucosidase
MVNMVDVKDLNFECEEVRKAVYDLMRFWIEKGCDGYRVSLILYILSARLYS